MSEKIERKQHAVTINHREPSTTIHTRKPQASSTQEDAAIDTTRATVTRRGDPLSVEEAELLATRVADSIKNHAPGTLEAHGFPPDITNLLSVS